MPTYEFVCTICGSHFEKNLHFDDSLSHVLCPNGHSQTQRLYSVPSIVYKGNGFYVTDNRTKVYRNDRKKTVSTHLRQAETKMNS